MVHGEPLQITVCENLKWYDIYVGMTALSHHTNTTATSGAILSFIITPQKQRKAEGNQ